MRRVSRRLHEDTRFRQRLFYGEMGLAEYHDLMDRFRAMIETRFARRNMEHDALRRWGEYRERVFAMILDKRASLMVFKLVDLGWGDLKHKKTWPTGSKPIEAMLFTQPKKPG